MSFFQQSVVKKHLNDLDKTRLQQVSIMLCSHFYEIANQKFLIHIFSALTRTQTCLRISDNPYNSTYTEIDFMMNELYELTEKEIKVMEGNCYE